VESRRLSYFVAVAELLHFGKAAARLHIAQPSLSQQIRLLEQELGVQLLQRTSRDVRLTEAGQILLDEARDILGRSARAAALVRSAGRGETGRLAVGFGPWMDCTIVPTIVRLFVERYPRVDIQLRTLSTAMQIEALRERRLDIGFVRQPTPAQSWLRSEPLPSEPFVAAIPSHHPRARGGPLDIHELSQEPFVAFPRETAAQLFDAIMLTCGHAGFLPRIRHEADNPTTVLAIVASGAGVALVPASLRRTKHPAIVFRSIRGARRVLRTMIAWRRDTSLATVETFLHVAHEATEKRKKIA
jgi:DNA-binding transcriptional LysR family regulator